MANTSQRDPLEIKTEKKRKIKQEEERIEEESKINLITTEVKSEEIEKSNNHFEIKHAKIEISSNEQCKMENDGSITEPEDGTEAEELKEEEKERNEKQERTKEESEEITVDVEVIELSDDDDYVVKPKRRRPRQLPRNAQCDICSKIFGDKHILKKHMIVHTDEKPHVCEICGKTFRHKHSLTSHKFSHQGPDAGRFFTCVECGASFKRKHTLRTHEQLHTGERPHRCHLCDRTFVQKVNLQQHIKVHINERNHPCDKCDKKFVTASKLKRHYQRHIKNQYKDLLKQDKKGLIKMPRVRKKTPQKIEMSSEEFLESDDDDVSDSENSGWVTVGSEREDSILS